MAVLGALSLVPLAHAGTIELEDPPDVVVEATGFFTAVDLEEPGHDPGLDLAFTNSAPFQYHVGRTKVVWLAADADGNTGTATTRVTVRDTTPPMFVDPPAYAEYFTPTGKKIPVRFEVPAVEDLVDIDVKVTSSTKSGSKLPLGNTTVTFTATDDHGNRATHELVVAVKRLVIENLALTRTHDMIRAEWDPVRDYDEFRVFITEAGDDERLVDARTGRNGYVFTNLEPSTEYEVHVFLQKEKRVGTSASISTLGEPFRVLFDFSDEVWPIAVSWDQLNTITSGDTSEPFPTDRRFNIVINSTVGRPSPSMQLSHPNPNFHYNDYRFDGIFIFNIIRNVPNPNGTSMYFGFDYKSDDSVPSLIDVRITNLDRPHVHYSQGSNLYTSTEWQRYTEDVTRNMYDGGDIRINIIAHTAVFNNGNALYLDNVYLGTDPPFDGFRGGSGE